MTTEKLQKAIQSARLNDVTCNRCRETLRELSLSTSGTKQALVKRLKDFSKPISVPKKYLTGLSPAEKRQRILRIKRGHSTSTKDPRAYAKFKTDANKKTRRSPYTTAFYKMYPGATSLSAKAKATGVPLKILKKVYDKGLAAWRTGHRPGATQEQWGYARVHSFLMKGCTYYSPDHTLADEAKSSSSRAVAHWKKVRKMCKK